MAALDHLTVLSDAGHALAGDDLALLGVSRSGATLLLRPDLPVDVERAVRDEAARRIGRLEQDTEGWVADGAGGWLCVVARSEVTKRPDRFVLAH